MRCNVVAMVLSGAVSLASPVLGGQTDVRLNALFDRLQVTDSETEAAAITNVVWSRWHETDK